MAFTRTTEVRHISPSELGKVAQLLNQTFAWKKLMQTVPSELTDPEHLSEGNPKYNFNHIKLIETASFKINKPPAQIFLEEWATSGRIRPTLSHLLQLLIRSELFRAADYVAVNLLSEAPPQRPTKGPAAKVDISLSIQNDDVGERISEMKYPNTSEIMNLNNGQSQSKVINNKQIFDRPVLVDTPISEVDLIRFSAAVESSANNEQNHQTNIVSVPPHVLNTTINRSSEDLQRPEDYVSNISVPRVASVNGSITSSIRTGPTALSQLNSQPNETTDDLTQTSLVNGINLDHSVQQPQYQPNNSSSEIFENILPDVSLLNLEPNDLINNLNSSQDNVEIPNLSVLNLTGGAEADPCNSIHQGFSEIIPQLSALIHPAEVSPK